MKIQFTTAKLPKSLFVYIEEEWIGWEAELDCFATLSEDGKTWTTYWSQFEYELLATGPDHDLWEYRGAEKGFLKQRLLPPFDKVGILSVEGTYGKFTSARCDDPLKSYSNRKNDKYSGPARFSKVYNALEVIHVFDHNGHKRTWFSAEIFKLYFTKGETLKFTGKSGSTSMRLLRSQVLKNAYSHMLDHNPSSNGGVYRGEMMESSTRKPSFAEFCYLVMELRKSGVHMPNGLLQL